MKFTFQNIPKCLLICISLLLFSCSQEQDLIKNQNSKKITIRQKSLDQVLNIPLFNEAYQKLVKTKHKIAKSSQARTQLEELYGFTIDSSEVKIIELENGTLAYNMLIVRDYISPDYFENLIIQIDSINNTDAFIIKYTPSEPIQSIDYHMSFSFVGKKEIQQILTSERVYYLSNGCYINYMTMCYWLVDDSTHPEWAYPHVAGSQCSNDDYLITISSDIICPPQNAGSDGIVINLGNQNSNISSYLGGISGTGGGIYTSPVLSPQLIKIKIFIKQLTTEQK